MKALTPKVIQEKLGLGWGWTRLAKYAECVDVDELKHFIETDKTFNRHNRREYTTRLTKNEKTHQRSGKGKRRAAATSTPTEVENKEPAGENDALVADGTEPEKGDANDAAGETVNDAAGETVHDTAGESLAETTQPEKGEAFEKDRVEELKQSVEESTQKIIALEKQHKALCSERWNLKEEMRPFVDEFRKMRARIQEVQQTIERAQKRLDETDGELEKLTAARLAEEKHRTELQAELDVLSTVEVYVDRDGRIADKSGEDFDVPEDWKEAFVTLRDSDAAEDYTIKEIRLAAKIMVVIAQFKQYALLVDSDRVSSLLAANGVVC